MSRKNQAINEYGVAVDESTIRFERLLPGPIERVWAYLTESGKRGEWLATGDTELHAGGRVEFHFRHSDLTPHDETIPDKYKQMENGASFAGTVTQCDPPRLLSYTWGWPQGDGSEVTFELTEKGEDVLLVLTHSRVKDSKAIVGYASGWHTHLGILVDKLNDRVPEPFWETHARAETAYAKRLS